MYFTFVFIATASADLLGGSLCVHSVLDNGNICGTGNECMEPNWFLDPYTCRIGLGGFVFYALFIIKDIALVLKIYIV